MLAGASRELAACQACSDPRLGVAQCGRNYLWTFRGLKICMFTESATNEVEDMEEERACRCNSVVQQQAMRVCFGPDMIWFDFVSRRPFPLEDAETSISSLISVAILPFVVRLSLCVDPLSCYPGLSGQPVPRR